MTNFPLLDAFLTMLWFFLWLLWIFLVIRVVTDVFRSEDLSGWGRAGWLIFVIVFPYIGVLGYVIARGSGMAHREYQKAEAADQAARSYLQSLAGTSASAAEEVGKLVALRDHGALTEQEFQAQKAKVLQ